MRTYTLYTAYVRAFQTITYAYVPDVCLSLKHYITFTVHTTVVLKFSKLTRRQFTGITTHALISERNQCEIAIHRPTETNANYTP